MSESVRFRIETAHLHDDGCQGWWWFPGETTLRATDGSRRGHTTSWLVAQCNKAGFSECEATALVSLSDLEVMLGAQ